MDDAPASDSPNQSTFPSAIKSLGGARDVLHRDRRIDAIRTIEQIDTVSCRNRAETAIDSSARSDLSPAVRSPTR